MTSNQPTTTTDMSGVGIHDETPAVVTDETTERVTLPDGRRVLWGSREHVTELRMVWLTLTPDAQSSIRRLFPRAVALITY